MERLKILQLKHLAQVDAILAGILIILILLSVMIVAAGSGQGSSKSGQEANLNETPVTLTVETVKPGETNYPAEETFPFQGKVTESGVRFREGPDVRTGRILAELSADVKVTVTSKVGDWYYVILENEVGYIHSDFIERVDD